MIATGCIMSFSKLNRYSIVLKVPFSFLTRNVYNKHFHTGLRNSRVAYSRTYNNISARTCTTGCDSFNLQDDEIQSITKGDGDLTKKLKVIILEVEVMRQEGLRVPSTMTSERWAELLSLSSRSQRLKILAFWWTNEKKKENDKKKKEANRLKREASSVPKEEESNDHIKYGFGGSSLFIRIYDSTIDNFHNYGLVRAMLYGQDLVVDCSYDEHMTPKEASLCAKQLVLMFSDNRVQDEPFNINFCNADRNGQVFKKLLKLMPTIYDDAFPINITDKSFTEQFPKEKLVYLTPHCREELKEFSHDDIYIIGAMVDRVNVDPLSLGKAKSLNLRMARLPLERYLDWGIGGKSLTINQMLSILHELKTHGDWDRALSHVPIRKLKRENDQSYSTKNRGLKRRVCYK